MLGYNYTGRYNERVKHTSLYNHFELDITNRNDYGCALRVLTYHI